MCCATSTGQGKFAGNEERTISSARGPPVDAPITTTPSLAPLGAARADEAAAVLARSSRMRRTTAVAFEPFVPGLFGLAFAALRTLATSSAETLSMDREIVPPGLGT